LQLERPKIVIHITTVYAQNCPQSYYDTTHKEEVFTGCGVALDQIVSADYRMLIERGQETQMVITRLGGLDGRTAMETWIADIAMLLPSTYPKRGNMVFTHIVYNNARKIKTYTGPIHRNHKQLTENHK
jgi:hypothetical protein